MTVPRLTRNLLERLPAHVRRPGHDLSGLSARWVHIGAGAFHRAHQAVYAQRLMEEGSDGWGIIAASLRSGTVAEQLAAQDHLYSVITQIGGEDEIEIIAALKDVIFAGERLADLIDAMAAPETALITITVTEKGYGLNAADQTLDAGRADIARDLSHPGAPRTLPGVICAGLAERMRRDGGPVTILSCDNLPDNGAAARACVTGFAERADPALARWMEESVTFPSSMVDRIVPAATEEDIAALKAAAGYRDTAMVKTEPFSQWVVEDNFAGERPPLEQAGVQLAADVAPWEMAKLRLLNGAHSAMAYLGGLAGVTFVHEFVAAASSRAYIERLWDESGHTLSPADGLVVSSYRADLMTRFSNPGLRHRLFQIAMDGSQKLPQRLVAPLVERAREGLESPALSLAIAGWMRWQAGRTDTGATYEVADPLAADLRQVLERAGPASRAQVEAFATFTPVFGTALKDQPGLKDEIASAIDSLQRLGAWNAMALCTARAPGD